MTAHDVLPANRLVVVIIGRNEGERLRSCLQSVAAGPMPVVYVDSGSCDGSSAMAQSLGAVTVDLDMSQAFTAARARNEGVRQIQEVAPQCDYVQFVDGDCEVATGWLSQASAFLASNADIAAVFGRRRERYPDRSIYNRLCDIEWDTPLGEIRACGGDVMMRIDAFKQVGGFRGDLIAGEEPELCVRLRAQGWRIWRLDAEMTLHDAAITRFGQWWTRTVRAGYAFANGAHLHGAPPERHWVREARSAWAWGLCLPLAIIVAAFMFGPWALAALGVYPTQVLRLLLRSRGTLETRFLRASFLVLGKFPEAFGALKFQVRIWSGGAARLIEYK